MGNLITRGLNPQTAFGRLQLRGNEEKKAELTKKYRYSLGHMFMENEVYTFDLTPLTVNPPYEGGQGGAEILNLPTPPTFNAKAQKL
jgi:hypothetical protein